MKSSLAWTIMRKELLDTLRDKRTILMMVAVPVLLYPCMLLLGIELATLHKGKLDRAVSRVGIESDAPELLKEWLSGTEKIAWMDSDNPRADLDARKLDAVLSSPPGFRETLDKGGSATVEVLYDSTEFASHSAENRLYDALQKTRDTLRDQRLEKAGLSKEYAQPIVAKSVDTAPAAKTTGFLLGMLIPVMLVVTIALGAFYPAVDLTAGEKERGTFETLLSTPAAKSDIVFGKFATVFILAMTTGLLNLASMALTSLFLITQMDAMFKDLPFSFNLPAQALVFSVVVMVPMALLLSAIMMASAVMARSFKEAQNYLTPVFMLIMLPAVMAGTPGMELGMLSQFVPIANVVLLFKALMTGKAGFHAAFLVLLSTSVFALLALQFAVWLFQREEVVLSEERGLPLSVHRSDFEPRNQLTPGAALAWFAVEVLLLLYLGVGLQHYSPLAGIVVTEWILILGSTLAMLWFLKVNARSALNLNRFQITHVGAGLLAAAGAWMLLVQVGILQNHVLPTPDEFSQGMVGLMTAENTPGGLLTLLLVFGASAGICEELLFRGVLLTGLRQRLGVLPAILLVGGLFGLFHLGVFRILPTALLGFLLTYVAVRSNSVVPSILIHAAINSFGVLAINGYAPEWLTRLAESGKPGATDMLWLPGWFLCLGFLLLGAGIVWMESVRHPRTNSSNTDHPSPF